MSSSHALQDLVTHLTQATGVSEAELSSILLMISVVAIGGAGVGLIVVCLRALLKPVRKPWLDPMLDMSEPAARPKEEAPASLGFPLSADGARSASEPPGLLSEAPLGSPASPMLSESPTTPGIAAVEIQRCSEPHIEPTARVPVSPETLAASEPSRRSEAQESDEEPPTKRSGNVPVSPAPAEPVIPAANGTGPFFGVGSPIPLVAKRAEEVSVVEGTLQTRAVPESVSPPTTEVANTSEASRTPSHSGLVMTVPEHAVRELTNFQYGARRA